MKLTDAEKLILVMLSEIYERLSMKADIDPQFIQEAINKNNTWALKWKYPGIFDSTAGDTPPLVAEVLEVLGMWTYIEESYPPQSAPDKARIESETASFGNQVKFRGFDGNNESEYLSAASFLLKHLGRYQNFAGRDLNSHGPSMPEYRRMLVVFKPMRSVVEPAGLSADQIIQLLNARRHI